MLNKLLSLMPNHNQKNQLPQLNQRATSSHDTIDNHHVFSQNENSAANFASIKRTKFIHVYNGESPSSTTIIRKKRKALGEVNTNIATRSATDPFPITNNIQEDPCVERLIRSMDDSLEIVEDSEVEYTLLIDSLRVGGGGGISSEDDECHTIQTSIPGYSRDKDTQLDSSQKSTKDVHTQSSMYENDYETQMEIGITEEDLRAGSSQLSNGNFHEQDLGYHPEVSSQFNFYTSQPVIIQSQAVEEEEEEEDEYREIIIIDDHSYEMQIDEESINHSQKVNYDSEGYNDAFEKNITEDDYSEEFDKRNILAGLSDESILSSISDDPRIDEILECSTQCSGEMETKIPFNIEDLNTKELVSDDKMKLIHGDNKTDIGKSEFIASFIKSAGIKQELNFPVKQEDVYRGTADHKPQSKSKAKSESSQLESTDSACKKETIEYQSESSCEPDSNQSKEGIEHITPPPSKPARKRVASKPLSALVGMSQPKFRVGLSKRVKIDSLHHYLKKNSK
ncbi:uncharacterized protein J8A68_000654 [[Candida] subhashii]|uniref:Uncharacterized protein n=1 Tax=[Candida] subhashii TaxID=561895 RepID=A0A8J5QRN4_9ASCO|nr:uncharacterized protein J8A68_000654 [[Candida] subhashii]KAG7665829.1 hypothetical protein J8A68_000654 [[Candida] subhashii]